MENPSQNIDPIFYRKLSFKEYIKRLMNVSIFYKQDIILSFFSFFVPTAVLIGIFFQDIPINILPTPQVINLKFLLYLFTKNLISLLFFSSLVFFYTAYFYRKIFHSGILFRLIFLRLAFFTLTFLLLLILSFTVIYFLFYLLSLFLSITVVLQFLSLHPYLLLSLGVPATLLLEFSLYIAISEGFQGIEALREALKTLQGNWSKSLIYFLLMSTFIFLMDNLVSNFLLLFIKKSSLFFFCEHIVVNLLSFLPYFFFALYYFNLRLLTKSTATTLPATDIEG